MTIRFLVLFFVLTSAVFGQTYEVRNARGDAASAVCIGVMSNQDKSNLGSRWVFVTNKHLFQNVKENRVWVGAADKKWHEGSGVHLSDNACDIASFTVSTGQFDKIRILKEVPNGIQAIVCGYTSKRNNFCFRGIIQNDKVLANGKHVLPGDSGGAVMVKGREEVFLAGLVYGYGVDDRNTLFVTTSELRRHIQKSYGCDPRCVPWSNSQCPLPKGSYRYERIDPKVFSPPRIERYEFVPDSESEVFEPPKGMPPPKPPKPPSLSTAEIRKIITHAVDQWFIDNASKIKGSPGKDGESGKTPKIDIQMLAEYIIENYSKEIQGPPGQEAPSENLTEIRNRIIALESKKRTLVLQEDGKEIDRQTYRNDQPIILDLKRFTRKK